MMDVLIFVFVWLVAAVPLGILAGSWLAHRRRATTRPLDRDRRHW